MRLLLVLLVIVLAWCFQPIAPGVWTMDVGACNLDYHTKPAQERPHLILACPGVDQVRLWPFPVQRPWWEDRGWPGGAPGRSCLAVAGP